MHTLISTLREHNFNLAAAALADRQLLDAASDPNLRASLESLLNLSRLCLALQATAARQALLSSLSAAPPDSPAEARRMANTLIRATAIPNARPAAGTALATVNPAIPPKPIPTLVSTPPPPPRASPSPPSPARQRAELLAPRSGRPSPASQLLRAAAVPPHARPPPL